MESEKPDVGQWMFNTIWFSFALLFAFIIVLCLEFKVLIIW